MALAKYAENETILRQLIEVDKYTQQQVADALGVDRTTVGRWCKKFDLATQPTGPRRGDKHPEWKGGRRLVGRYWYVYQPDHPHTTRQRYVAEHRLVMEAKLGRYLEPTEVVHHIDGNPANNAPDNLMVFPKNSIHLKHELKGRVPNWTPEGRQRTLDGVRRGNANRHKSKSGVDQRPQTSDRPSS